MVAPMFESARQAWRDAGRDGSPRLVAIGYFAFEDVSAGRRNVSNYYQATGAEFAEAQATRVNVGPDGVKSAVATFEALGADELILHPASRSGRDRGARESRAVAGSLYREGAINVLLGKVTSSTLCAVSTPATGRPSGSSRPS